MHNGITSWLEPRACEGRRCDDRLGRAIDRGTSWLLAQQAPEGYWCSELEADTTLESDYILYLHILGRLDPVPKLATYIRRRQLPDGGWSIYEGGPSELNATVKAYFALKLAGDPIDAPGLARARRRVHELGGIERTNSFTRFYLVLVGALEWDMVPAVPPELVTFPRWLPLSIYRMSSWTRAIIVPLTILYALKPCWRVAPEARVDELFRDQADRHASFAWDARAVSWRNVFLALDGVARLYERLPWKPLRGAALAGARRWLLRHVERSDGLAAIYPAIMNATFALLALGYEPDDPPLASQMDALLALEIEDRETIRVQPCVSPVWDTAIALTALAEAGLPAEHPALVKAADWLLDRQILAPGDWQLRNRTTAPGGWAFEFRNDFYPDVDDTAFVLIALLKVNHSDPIRLHAAIERGLTWMISMQNDDGGWGAFDRNNDTAILTHVPFADHNAMIDPSTVDVTARVLECLACLGRAGDPAVARGLAYLRREQKADGSWYGRWGVNYLYGTGFVLRSAQALDLTNLPWVQRGASWVQSVQNLDGGFGETCASYEDPAQKGRGPSTPSQTAWALIGLLGDRAAEDDRGVDLAVEYLLDSQNSSGSWDEMATTGTGFPGVFYLKYHMYRHAFPLAALGRYRGQVNKSDLALAMADRVGQG
jgi:squalene-hopene/tetraprenyl-beta-curcumene cyclase